jgi:hypothetical protein
LPKFPKVNSRKLEPPVGKPKSISTGAPQIGAGRCTGSVLLGPPAPAPQFGERIHAPARQKSRPPKRRISFEFIQILQNKSKSRKKTRLNLAVVEGAEVEGVANTVTIIVV